MTEKLTIKCLDCRFSQSAAALKFHSCRFWSEISRIIPELLLRGPHLTTDLPSVFPYNLSCLKQCSSRSAWLKWRRPSSGYESYFIPQVSPPCCKIEQWEASSQQLSGLFVTSVTLWGPWWRQQPKKSSQRGKEEGFVMSLREVARFRTHLSLSTGVPT